MKASLPSQYIAYFVSGGLVEGFLDGPPGYFALWHPDEIEKNNADLQVDDQAPGFLGFGGDGGGEMLAFDRAGAVVLLPMIGMEPQYAQPIANSWGEFEQRLRTTGRAE